MAGHGDRDAGTGKPIGRALFDKGDSMPVQFNPPKMGGTPSGVTVNLGSIMGGGFSQATRVAGQAVSPMPPIPKGAIFGE